MSTVADVVIANPAAARVFERHGIDYCCNGQRPLVEACRAAGVEMGVVQTELAAVRAAGSADETLVPPNDVGALIAHILATHHTYLRRELPRLNALMSKVVDAHSEAYPELSDVAVTLDELTADLLAHLMKEEKVLFPLVIELLGAVELPTFHCGSVANPLRMMYLEHDRAGELLATLRDRTNGYDAPEDACPTWRALYEGLADLEVDTHTHVHLENNLLFPQISALESALS